MVKRVLMILLALLFVLGGCGSTKDQHTFTGVIDAVQDKSIMVTVVSDEVDFDKASVDLSDADYPDELLPGQTVLITIRGEIRESYPVQTTGIRIELVNQEEDSQVEYRKITPERAKEMMDQGGVIIVDVRTADEFAAGHIEGALLLPDTEIREKAEDVLLDKDARILLYCRSGVRSAFAAKVLLELGYTDVYDFGGIIQWPYEVIR